jgi:4-amino-4-deoxy-L-arabinose transferase-like glycosyltransferase
MQTTVLTKSRIETTFAPLYSGWLVALICLAVNLVALGLRPFDGLYGQDSYSYYAHSVELHERFSLFHHWQWEDQPRLLYWPIGYPLLNSLFFKVFGSSANIAQLISLLCWAGVSGLLADLTRRLASFIFSQKFYPLLAGIIAGLLVIFSPLGRQASVTVMADAATLFWTVLAVWLAFTARESGSGWRVVACGVALGVASITRYFALTALPLVLLALFYPKYRGWKPAPTTNWVWLSLGSLGLGLVCLPQMIINLVYPDPLWGNSWLAGWSPANWFRTAFETRDGFASYQFSPLLFNLFGVLLNPRFLTFAIIPPLLLGIFVLVKYRQIFTLLWLFCWWLLPVLFLAGLPYENERYSLTFLPPLAIFSAIGATWLIKMLSVKKWLMFVALVGLIVGFVGLGWLSQRHINGFIAVKDNDLAVMREVEKILPPDAKLITFSISLTFDRYTAIPTSDLYFSDQNRLNKLLNQAGQTYLLVDGENMRQQWSNHFVGENYRNVFARAKTPAIAKFGKYELWLLAP